MPSLFTRVHYSWTGGQRGTPVHKAFKARVDNVLDLVAVSATNATGTAFRQTPHDNIKNRNRIGSKLFYEIVWQNVLMIGWFCVLRPRRH